MLIPKKRTALDGKTWWCVYDLNKHTFSTLICFGKYKTKKDCLFAINKKIGATPNVAPIFLVKHQYQIIFKSCFQPNSHDIYTTPKK